MLSVGFPFVHLLYHADPIQQLTAALAALYPNANAEINDSYVMKPTSLQTPWYQETL